MVKTDIIDESVQENQQPVVTGEPVLEVGKGDVPEPILVKSRKKESVPAEKIESVATQEEPEYTVANSSCSMGTVRVGGAFVTVHPGTVLRFKDRPMCPTSNLQIDKVK